MVFNRQTKQAFVLPPKTGTSTIESLLRSLGWKLLEQRHSKLEDMLINYPNLNNYKIYGFLRNPLMRFKSAIRAAVAAEDAQAVLEEITDPEETFSIKFPKKEYKVFANLFFEPQFNWLNNPKITILDFDNFEKELRKILNDENKPIPKLNASRNFDSVEISQSVRDFVRQKYAVDYALAKDRLGKEYPL
jgi:hypothetical protein